MSVRFSGSGANLLWAGATGITNNSYTILGYVKIKVDRNAFSGIIGIGTDAVDPTDVINTSTLADGTTLSCFANAGGTSGTIGSFSATVDVWYGIAYVKSGGVETMLVFADTSSTTPLASDNDGGVGRTYTGLDNVVIGRIYTGEDLNAEVENVKVFVGAGLTNAQIRAELSSYAVINTTNQFAAWALKSTAANTNGLVDTVSGKTLTNTSATNGASTPAQLASSTYTLTCDTASYALTGNATGLLAGRKLTADQQTYTLTGNATTLTYASGGAHTLTCDTQTYVLTGIDVVLSPQSPPAQYVLTGNDVGLLASTRVLTCDQQTYTLTGVAVGFLTTHVLTCTTAAYVLNGTATNLVYSNAPAGGGAGTDSVRPFLRPYYGVKRRLAAYA